MTNDTNSLKEMVSSFVGEQKLYQRAIKENIKNLEKTVGEMAMTVTALKFQVEEISKINQKQSSMIDASFKIGRIIFIFLGMFAFFLGGENASVIATKLQQLSGIKF